MLLSCKIRKKSQSKTTHSQCLLQIHDIIEVISERISRYGIIDAVLNVKGNRFRSDHRRIDIISTS